MSNQSKVDIQKNMITTMDQLLSSTHVPDVFVKRFEERALKELYEVETRLAEYKRELVEKLTGGCSAVGGMNSHDSLFEFACDDNKIDIGTRKGSGMV